MGDAEMLEWLFEQTISDPSTGCAVWSEACVTNGYGRTTYKGRMVYTHRLVWILTNGPLEPDQYVLHRCDIPPCCRLEHLFVGTMADNMADRDTKGRQARGEANGSAKLTQGAVDEIKRRYRGIWGQQRALAAEFGVSNQQINYIVNGKKWKYYD